MMRRTHIPAKLAVICFLLVASCSGDDENGAATAEQTRSESVATVPTSTGPTSTTAADSADPLAGIGEVELIDESFGYTEGPQWIPDEGVLLFTDISGTIFRLASDDKITVFRRPSNGASGLALDPEGRLLAAEAKTRRVTRTERDGTVTPIAERFEGTRLNQPNDIAVRSDGTIYFTDPVYGGAPTDLDFRGVFRIAPDGTLTAERRGSFFEEPNGIAMSPDESRLYVANTADDLVWEFDVDADGSLSEAREFVETEDGPDGMTADNAGNLFVATGSGIEAFAPDGTRWGIITVPRWPANCTFGGADGRTLYITASEGLYRVTLSNPGPY